MLSQHGIEITELHRMPKRFGERSLNLSHTAFTLCSLAVYEQTPVVSSLDPVTKGSFSRPVLYARQ